MHESSDTKIVEHDKCAEYIAKIICIMVGIDAIDRFDGSAKWFMFYNDAVELLDSLRNRGFSPDSSYVIQAAEEHRNATSNA